MHALSCCYLNRPSHDLSRRNLQARVVLAAQDKLVNRAVVQDNTVEPVPRARVGRRHSGSCRGTIRNQEQSDLLKIPNMQACCTELRQHTSGIRLGKQIDLFSKPDTRCVLAQLDRKSTRLNSSHQIISYAVFCLKKKKAMCHHN